MPVLVLSVAAGLALALIFTAAPLAVCVAALGAAMFVVARRGVPAGERRILTILLSVAIAARLAFIVLVFLKNLPHHHDQWLGELSGDGAYGLSRALRARDLLTGVPTNKFDAFVVSDIYGANAYVTLLTVLQMFFGPVPYSIRLLNGLLFLTGAVTLFWCTRSAFGRLPAFAALTVVLFLPSFFVWSASLLKEPLYFACTAVFLVTASRSLRSTEGSGSRVIAAALAVGTLVVMEGVRHKTFAIGLLGWTIAAVMLLIGRRPRVFLPIAAAIGIAGLAMLRLPAVQEPLLAGLGESAKIHAGHVFTLGHGYKLLDEGFYYRVQDPNSSTLTLTADEATRYVLRAIVSFVLVPVPWQAISLRELMYVPEQLVWYVLVALLPIGAVAGWRRDPAATAVFLGYLIPTSLVLALTNGNVGTMVRLRGMVMIIVIWVSALGLCAALEWAIARSPRVDAGWPAMRPEAAS